MYNSSYITLAVAQVFNLDPLLLLTRRLLHLAGVVIGMAIRGANWVEADVGAVNVTHAPATKKLWDTSNKE